jgi:hypothetical protein
MKSLIVVVFVLISGLQAQAKAHEIFTEINYGDRTSSFRIYEKSGGKFFSYRNSYGKSSDGTLTESSYKFIRKKADEVLKHSSNDINFCLRKFIVLKTVFGGKTAERKACIGSPSPTAKKMTELTNTLELLL